MHKPLKLTLQKVDNEIGCSSVWPANEKKLWLSNWYLKFSEIDFQKKNPCFTLHIRISYAVDFTKCRKKVPTK